MLGLYFLLFAASIHGISSGALNIPILETLFYCLDYFFNTKLSRLEGFEAAIIFELRLPRILLAAFTGSILAITGCAMQGLFRNPLADPGIIGVSSGAATGAVIAITLLPMTSQVWSIPLFAFIFGLLTTLLVYKLAQSSYGTSIFLLLLSGIAISAFSGALIGFLSYFTSSEKLKDLSVWQMGSVAHPTTLKLLMMLCILTFLMVYFKKHASSFNALLLGEAEARHLGIEVESFKYRIILLTAVAIAICVSSTGIIGFVGLAIPHLIRLINGPNYKYLIPLSAIAGALLMVFADTLSRTLASPTELPIGLLTALLGAPFFMMLLIQQKRNLK